jgi:uncharacterized protein (TIGR01777 family)
MRIFVTGGTGLVGTRLVRALQGRGDHPVVLSRHAAGAREKFGQDVEIVEGDPMKTGPWTDALAGCDGVIHLAGENVFNKRWNDEFKKLMWDSRTRSTENVVNALARNPRRADGTPKVLVNASAIGYYGPHADEELTEDSPPAEDYMARLCVEWEMKAREAEAHGVRVVMVRVGIVLDKEGGALSKLLTPFKLCVGGKVASGKQWMSWIHHDDMVGLFLFGLDNPGAKGPLNGTAPNPVTNKQFSKSLGKALHRPTIFPTPGFVLRVMLGGVAAVVTTGQRVLPARPLALGFHYKYPTIDEAFADILK